MTRRRVHLAAACHCALMASYYVLRPVRDTVATVLGVQRLPVLFTATFVGTLVASLLYTSLASRVRLKHLLPGVFWLIVSHIVLFVLLFHLWPHDLALGAAFYVWFSVVNLFMISVFWSYMVDTFTPAEATRSFGWIAAGGAIGAILGPFLMRQLFGAWGLQGMLVVAAAGLTLVIAMLRGLVQERAGDFVAPAMRNSCLTGFQQLVRSPYALIQSAFMLLMTWVNTVAYYFQTDLITRAYADLTGRAQAIADIDLTVNIATAVILLLGLRRFVQRFGVTVSLLLNPVIMIVGFVLTAIAPGVGTIQALQIVRRTGQYAVARPSREICFTVVAPAQRYQAKNLIDTVIYRGGDLSSVWLVAALRSGGQDPVAAAAMGIGGSVLWCVAALALGNRFEKLRAALGVPARRGDRLT